MFSLLSLCSFSVRAHRIPSILIWHKTACGRCGWSAFSFQFLFSFLSFFSLFSFPRLQIFVPPLPALYLFLFVFPWFYSLFVLLNFSFPFFFLSLAFFPHFHFAHSDLTTWTLPPQLEYSEQSEEAFRLIFSCFSSNDDNGTTTTTTAERNTEGK